MGACVSCNSRTRTEMQSSDLERKTKLLSECKNTFTPTGGTTSLLKQSAGTEWTDVRDDSSGRLKKNQQDYQNTQLQETMPSLQAMVNTSAAQRNIESPLHKPKFDLKKSHSPKSTSTNLDIRRTLSLRSSISFPPLHSEVSDCGALYVSNSKPPQRMQSEPSIGRPILLGSQSEPPCAHHLVCHSAPPSRTQSVSDIQLEIARTPLLFTKPKKVPPPSKRKSAMDKFLSFSRNKGGVKDKVAQDYHKKIKARSRDSFPELIIGRSRSSMEMKFVTDST